MGCRCQLLTVVDFAFSARPARLTPFYFGEDGFPLVVGSSRARSGFPAHEDPPLSPRLSLFTLRPRTTCVCRIVVVSIVLAPGFPTDPPFPVAPPVLLEGRRARWANETRRHLQQPRVRNGTPPFPNRFQWNVLLLFLLRGSLFPSVNKRDR